MLLFLFSISGFYDYHIFLIATLVFTRLLLDETYHLIEDSTLTDSTLFWRTLLESAIYVHTVKTLICVRNQRYYKN